jgi:hypothetical protein
MGGSIVTRQSLSSCSTLVRTTVIARRKSLSVRSQRARGESRYTDAGDSKEKPPAGVMPVVRFKTPLTGEVTWDDQVKGPITVANQELDDLVIVRGDGVPTRFGVVVDDIDEHHARDSRRRPRQQHAAPDQHIQGARSDAAQVRTCR